MLTLVAAVAVVAFLIGRASVGWFDDPPRQPMVVPTAAAGDPAPVLAAPAARGDATPRLPAATATPRPIGPPTALPSPQAARPSPSPDTDPAFSRPTGITPTAELTPSATRRADRTPTPPSTATADEGEGADDRPGCDPAYPTVCIPPPPPNGDCSITEERNFPVRPPDPHGLDSDNDGIGCEPVGSP
jgi:hypothetical protein